MPPRPRPLHSIPGAVPPPMVDGVTGPVPRPATTTVTPPPTTPPPTTAPSVPAETAPAAPDLLAALDAGDDAAVWAWVRAHTPEPQSLLLYGLLVAVGVAGLVEWPALAVSALGQFIVDRRFGGVEQLAAELRARVDALTPA